MKVQIDRDLAGFLNDVAQNNGIDVGRYVNDLLAQAVEREKAGGYYPKGFCAINTEETNRDR